MKKPVDRPESGILLTPGSSRRKMAWKRLRNSKTERGMTQDQVDAYLKSFMKKHYQKVQKEGALTFDKIERYLEYLSKLASKTLVQSAMDQKKVADFTEKIKPVIEDVGEITAITEADVAKHSSEIQQQAKQHLEDLRQPENQFKIPSIDSNKPQEPAPIHSQDTLEKPLSDEEKSKDEIKTADNSTNDGLLAKEIVPIGFEDGAPLVSVDTFFRFPLSGDEKEPESGHLFDMHLKYLDLAVKEARLREEELESIRSIVTEIPVKRYSNYFDIFPNDEYDDAQLMIIFSQWRNKILDRFLIED